MTERPKDYVKEGNQSAPWLWLGVVISILLAFGKLIDFPHEPRASLGALLIAAGIGLRATPVVPVSGQASPRRGYPCARGKNDCETSSALKM